MGDAGSSIYTWFGSECNSFEKRKAGAAAGNLAEERDGHSKVMDHSEDSKQFWELLGGPGSIKSAKEGDQPVDTPVGEGILYKLSDDSGGLMLHEVARNQLSHTMLDSSNTFILDTTAELYVWLGKSTSEDERQEAMPTALQFLAAQGRPEST